MEKYVDVLLERASMVRHWRLYIQRIFKATRTVLPDARIYIFGSVLREEATAGSDVDILIVSDNLPESNLERSRIRIRIEELAGLPPHHPFELHLANQREAEWYLKRTQVEEVRE